jgi:rod shape-determining protein MreC
VKAVPFLQTFLILILISLAIFGLDKLHFLSLPKTAVGLITNPISFGLYQTKQQVSEQLYFIFAARVAAQQNKALKEQLGFLLSENANLRTKLAETESLLQQDNALNKTSYKLIPARPMGLDRYLLIDKGSNDGVKLNQAVIFKDSFIGEVVKVNEKSAAVKLSTDPDSKLSAFTSGPNGKAKGILLGQFGSEMKLDKILHQEPIEISYLVYAEGIETFLPRGLVLGTVTEVLEQNEKNFKSAKVAPVFKVGDLDLVFVIGD